MPMKNPPHPRRMIKTAIEELGLSIPQAAEALGVSRAQLHRVTARKSAVSPEMALRLEFVIGSSADAWLRMQAAFDAAEVRSRATEITKGLKRMPDPESLGSDQPTLS